MLFKSFGCFFLASSESVLSELKSLDESETRKHQPPLQINISKGAFKLQICKVLQSCEIWYLALEQENTLHVSE
jgi:hypothetical protein